MNSVNRAMRIMHVLQDNAYGTSPSFTDILSKKIMSIYKAGLPALVIWLTSMVSEAYDNAKIVVTVLNSKIVEETHRDFFHYTSDKVVKTLGVSNYIWYIDQLVSSLEVHTINQKSAINLLNWRVTLYGILTLNLDCCRMPKLNNVTTRLVSAVFIKTLISNDLSSKEKTDIIERFTSLLTEE